MPEQNDGDKRLGLYYVLTHDINMIRTVRTLHLNLWSPACFSFEGSCTRVFNTE